MGLYRTCIALPHSRPVADVAHSVELLPYRFDLHKVHSVCRHKLKRLIELHVRCRETYRAADPVASHNDTFKRIPVPKHCGCTFNISLLEVLTDLCRTYGIPMLRRNHIGPYNLKPEHFRSPCDLVRTLGIASHPVVISEQNGLCAIIFNEHAEVLLRSHCAEVLREAKNLNLVHAQTEKKLLLFRKRSEKPE